jgi:plastocyanin
MLLFVLVFAGSAVLLYGGAQLVDEEQVAAADDGGAGGTPGGPVTVTIVGKNSQFAPRSVVASAGAQVTVTFDNQDAGVLHNIQFFANRNRTGELGKTEISAGPAQHTVSFTAPAAPGSYPFICDVHPDTMTGTLTVR